MSRVKRKTLSAKMRGSINSTGSRSTFPRQTLASKQPTSSSITDAKGVSKDGVSIDGGGSKTPKQVNIIMQLSKKDSQSIDKLNI